MMAETDAQTAEVAAELMRAAAELQRIVDRLKGKDEDGQR